MITNLKINSKERASQQFGSFQKQNWMIHVLDGQFVPTACSLFYSLISRVGYFIL